MGKVSRKRYGPGGNINGRPARPGTLSLRPVAPGISDALGVENIAAFQEILSAEGLRELDSLVIQGELDKESMLEWARVLPECLNAGKGLAKVAEEMAAKLTEGKLNAEIFQNSVLPSGKVNRNGGIYWIFGIIVHFVTSQGDTGKSTFRGLLLYRFCTRLFALVANEFVQKAGILYVEASARIVLGAAGASGIKTWANQPNEVIRAVIAQACSDFKLPHGSGIVTAIQHTNEHVSKYNGRFTHMEQEIIREEGKKNVKQLQDECTALFTDVVEMAAFRKIELHETKIGKCELYVYGDDLPPFKSVKATILCLARLHLEAGKAFVYPKPKDSNKGMTVTYVDGCIEIFVDRGNGELYIAPTLVPLSFFMDEKPYLYLRRCILGDLKEYLEAKGDDIMPVRASEAVVARELAKGRARVARALDETRRGERRILRELKEEERQRRIAARLSAGECIEDISIADVSVGKVDATHGEITHDEEISQEDAGTDFEDSLPVARRSRVSFSEAGSFTDAGRFVRALGKLFDKEPRQTGGHVIFNLSDYQGEVSASANDRGIIVVPVHGNGELPKPCICQALNRLGLSVERFAELY